MNIEFGVPSQRTKKPEKHPYTAVATVEALGTKKGSAKKISFNKKAIELLGLADEDAQVSLSFAGVNIYVVNTTSMDAVEEGERYNVTKNAPRAFSNSKVYKYVSKVHKLDNSVENFFELAEVEGSDYNGKPIFVLIPKEITTASEDESASDTIAEPVVSTEEAFPFSGLEGSSNKSDSSVSFE